MEGRVPPPGGAGGQNGDGNYPPLPPPPSSSSTKTLSLPMPNGTYVIQIPRDQVYRVPPPENAKIVESYLGTRPQNTDPCCRQCCIWFLVPLLVLGVLIGIIVGTIKGLYVPETPEFSIARVHFKNSRIDTILRVENVNRRMKVVFGRGGKSSMIFNDHVVAEGKYPPSSLEPRGTTDVDLKMNASKKLSGKGHKAKIVKLKVRVPIEISSWNKKEKKDLRIACVFKVNSFEKNTKVLSQDCKTTS